LHNRELLVSGVLVFAAGIIKYVERIWCLKCGSLEGLESTKRNMTRWDWDIDVTPGDYAQTLLEALGSMRYVIGVFVSSGDLNVDTDVFSREDSIETVKLARLQLGLMYDELYTKALVLRTRSWMISRHISQICVVVAFVLFHVIMDKQRRYLKADVAITYSLFIGGFFIEVCSVLNSMVSPWTWKMLRDQNWEWLTMLSWYVFSSDIGWPEKKQWWPCSFGQYNFLSWQENSKQQPKTTFGQRVMAVVRRVLVDLVGVNKKKIFWMSKVLDPWYVDADKFIMEHYLVDEIILLASEIDGNSPTREWPNLGRVLKHYDDRFDTNFGEAIVHMHVLTELHLRRYSDMAASDDVAFGRAQVCRKLSNYMMYLLVVHPSMLPLNASSVRVLESCQRLEVSMEFYEKDLHPSKKTVEEMVYMWTRLLLYAAGKSRTELQAAQLASTGGELITLAWLLMAFYELGDSQSQRVRIISTPDKDITEKEVCAFNFIARTNKHAQGINSSISYFFFTLLLLHMRGEMFSKFQK
jgi:hypothetical protein